MKFILKYGAEVVINSESINGKVHYLDFVFDEVDGIIETIQYKNGPVLPLEMREIRNAIIQQKREKLAEIMEDLNYLESLEKVEILEKNLRATINMRGIPYGAIVRFPRYLDEKKGVFLRYSFGLETRKFDHEYVNTYEGKRQFTKRFPE